MAPLTPTQAKASERANIKAGNVSVRGWIPAHEAPQFKSMQQRAQDALKQTGETK